MNIDYCCGGNRTLTEALAQKKISEEEARAHLEAIAKLPTKYGQDFASLTIKKLCTHITNIHHAYLWQALPQIGNLFLAVLRAHGAKHGELFPIAKSFGMLRGDLEQHLLHEELVLFPALSEADEERLARELVPELIGEHERAGKLLEEMREAARDYTAPPDACQSYILLYQMLSELEEDLHKHIHLENNIAFKPYDIR